MTKLKYILDANVFITPSRTYYSFDFGTKFWDFLLKKAKSGLLCSIDKVHKEIEQGDKNDPLKKWAEQNFERYFYPTANDEVIEHYKSIINIISTKNQYSDSAKNDFFTESNADPWVIAFAKYKNLTVVTFEKSNINSKRKIFIPDVCKSFNINCLNLFEMLKELKFKL